MSTILKTPVGRILFSHMVAPTVYDAKNPKAVPNPPTTPGHYETLLVLDPANPKVEKFLEELEAAADEAAGMEGSGQRKDPLYSLQPDLDEDKEPTGHIRLKFRVPAGWSKDSIYHPRTVPFFDHLGEPFKPQSELGNGSTASLSFEPRAYKTGGVIGVTLRLRACQTVQPQWYGQSASSDFAGVAADIEDFDI